MSDTTPGAEPTPEPTPDPATPGSGWSSADASRRADEAVATLRKANPLDLATIGAGLLVFLGSLLPYYTWSVDVPMPASNTTSITAWHGAWGWLGALLALAGAAVLVLHLVGSAIRLPARTVVLALFALGTLLTLLALVTTPGPDCSEDLGALCDLFDEGRGVGYWLALLGSIAGTALAALRRAAP